jgi:pyruvate/2-oxoglutarate dehydrogenase complex dihydrolipoamide acyltransferase (E2) component
MQTETKAAFARRHGVNRSTVQKWQDKGLLVIAPDGMVNVEATEWNLDQRPTTYRGGVTLRPVRAKDGNNASHAEAAPKPAPKPAPEPQPRPAPLDSDGGQEDAFDPDDPNLPTAIAVRRKENWLGLHRKQIVERDGSKLVDRPAAELAFFEEGRALRDAWLAWPARVAIEMADELKIEPRQLTPVLTAYVKKHLTELGEPSAGEFG